jgi:protein-tyrosine phosphatase
MEEALELARLAVANGITGAVVTPHIQPGVYENSKSSIQPVFNEFQQAVQAAKLPLKLGMAAEVRISPEVISLLAADEIPFLGEEDGFKYMLLEFPHGNIPPGSDKMVAMLLDQKICPVIAHPERNMEVVHNFERIEPFVQQGCLLQVTSGSIAGRFGPYVQQCAHRMFERDWVYILASDAHNNGFRSPELESGRKAAAEIIGEEASWKLVQDHPEGIGFKS